MPYITEVEVEKYLAININPALASFITTLIGAVTNYIEKYTDRVFEAPSPDDDETKYYDGNDTTKLQIDDLRTLTSLTVDDVALTEDTDFLLYPLNEDPKEWIELIQPETRINTNSRLDSTSPYVFDKGQATISIVGKFGYSATPPDDIKLVAMKLVGGIIKENVGDTDTKELTQETIGDYSASYAKIKEMAFSLGVNTILNQYIREPLPKAMSGHRMIE